MDASDPVDFVIIGASGDLATRKIFPALFALFARGQLPADTRFAGFSRSALTDDAFRSRLAASLACEELPGGVCDEHHRAFLARCRYHAGDYGDPQAFVELDRRLAADAGARPRRRVYYLAVPPAVFAAAARALHAADRLRGGECAARSRVVVEKPFGHDRASSDRLTAELRAVFSEEQIYRIDHYLGKEVVQNLLVLRFANTIFEPVWNRDYVRHVHIHWSEDLSLAGRAGYFDESGIIRDVMQNHLTQILALVAMECPWERGAEFVRDEKVRLLRQIPPLRREQVVLGQYGRGHGAAGAAPAYREEPGVPPQSRTPTYAAAVFDVRSPRWRGVPFFVSAGKGLATRSTEIRLHFRAVEHGLFRDLLDQGGGRRGGAPLPDNELVIQIQPRERICLRIVNKAPGHGFRLDTPRLDLVYRQAYRDARIGDAYENLLLDVLRGDQSLFIRDDELQAAWDIFTPLLHAWQQDGDAAQPESYPFGGAEPAAAVALAARHGIEDARCATPLDD